MRITASAAPALHHDDFLARLNQVRDDFASRSIAGNRAQWNLDTHILTAVPGFALGAALAPIFRDKVALAAERYQRVDRRRGDQDHVAAFATVAAIWPAARNVRFAAKVTHTIATVATLHIKLCFIEKHRPECTLLPECHHSAE